MQCPTRMHTSALAQCLERCYHVCHYLQSTPTLQLVNYDPLCSWSDTILILEGWSCLAVQNSSKVSRKGPKATHPHDPPSHGHGALQVLLKPWLEEVYGGRGEVSSDRCWPGVFPAACQVPQPCSALPLTPVLLFPGSVYPTVDPQGVSCLHVCWYYAVLPGRHGPVLLWC